MNDSNGKVVGLLERIAIGQEQTRDEVKQIRDEVKQLRGEMNELRGEVGGLRGEVSGLRGEVGGLRGEVGGLRGEVRQTNVRLDHVIGFMGAHHRDHEQRIRALEDEVFKEP
jgi:chromosome segregation ATPase